MYHVAAQIKLLQAHESDIRSRSHEMAQIHAHQGQSGNGLPPYRKSAEHLIYNHQNLSNNNYKDHIHNNQQSGSPHRGSKRKIRTSIRFLTERKNHLNWIENSIRLSSALKKINSYNSLRKNTRFGGTFEEDWFDHLSKYNG